MSNSTRKFPVSQNHDTWSPASSTIVSGKTPTKTERSAMPEVYHTALQRLSSTLGAPPSRHPESRTRPVLPSNRPATCTIVYLTLLRAARTLEKIRVVHLSGTVLRRTLTDLAA